MADAQYSEGNNDMVDMVKDSSANMADSLPTQAEAKNASAMNGPVDAQETDAVAEDSSALAKESSDGAKPTKEWETQSPWLEIMEKHPDFSSTPGAYSKEDGKLQAVDAREFGKWDSDPKPACSVCKSILGGAIGCVMGPLWGGVGMAITGLWELDEICEDDDDERFSCMAENGCLICPIALILGLFGCLVGPIWCCSLGCWNPAYVGLGSGEDDEFCWSCAKGEHWRFKTSTSQLKVCVSVQIHRDVQGTEFHAVHFLEH